MKFVVERSQGERGLLKRALAPRSDQDNLEIARASCEQASARITPLGIGANTTGMFM